MAKRFLVLSFSFFDVWIWEASNDCNRFEAAELFGIDYREALPHRMFMPNMPSCASGARGINICMVLAAEVIIWI
jgi:hypothetical protein